MSRADVKECVLLPMQATFYSRRELDEVQQKAALETYAAVLEPFDPIDLKAGYAAAAGKWDKGGWPSPNFILVEVRKARERRLPPERDANVLRYGRPSQNLLWRRWLDTRSSQLGYDAAQAGVSWMLKCLILNDGVAPPAVDLDRLKRAKMGARVVKREIEEGVPIPFSSRLLKVTGLNRDLALTMWANLERNEEVTAAEVRRAWETRGSEPADPTDNFWNRDSSVSNEELQGLIPA